MKPKRTIRGAGEPKTGCRPHAQDLAASLQILDVKLRDLDL